MRTIVGIANHSKTQPIGIWRNGFLLGTSLSLARAQAAGGCAPGPSANCPADVGESRVQQSEPPRIGVADQGHDADAGHSGAGIGASHSPGGGAHGGAGGSRSSGSGGGGHGGGGGAGGGGGGHGK